MLLAVLIFVATIALVIWQPKGLGIGWSAMGGAVVALLAGVVTLSDVPVVCRWIRQPIYQASRRPASEAKPVRRGRLPPTPAIA